jgi:hypothetical protein
VEKLPTVMVSYDPYYARKPESLTLQTLYKGNLIPGFMLNDIEKANDIGLNRKLLNILLTGTFKDMIGVTTKVF